MSNEKTSNSPAPPAKAVRIKHVRFATNASRQGVSVASPREAADQIAAREPGRPSGYDIWFMPERRAFRFDHYDGGQFHVSKWITEANVFSYEDAD